MTILAAAAIASGELVKTGLLVGVACTDIANGDTGDMELEGVFEVPKEAEALTQGAVVYFKAATKSVTATATSNTICGYVWKDAASGDATCQIMLLW